MAVGMTDLSQEIIHLIASYLPRWENGERANMSERGRALLPAYATISRSWQYTIESLTFHQVGVSSTDIGSLSRIAVNHRRKLLKRLDFLVILPTYSDKACAKFETTQDKQSNDRVFTTAMRDLLTLLRSWHVKLQATGNNDVNVVEPLLLCIGDCYSPSDSTYRGHEKYDEDVSNWESGKRQDLFQHRYASSLLQLESIEELPDVPQVTFFVRSSSERRIEPRSIALLSTKFPNLNGLRWYLDDNEKLDTQLRQQTRLGE